MELFNRKKPNGLIKQASAVIAGVRLGRPQCFHAEKPHPSGSQIGLDVCKQLPAHSAAMPAWFHRHQVDLDRRGKSLLGEENSEYIASCLIECEVIRQPLGSCDVAECRFFDSKPLGQLTQNGGDLGRICCCTADVKRRLRG